MCLRILVQHLILDQKRIRGVNSADVIIKDENGKITIDDVAAGEDIRKIERAQSILQNALQSLRAAQTEGANSKGETAQAIYDKSQELINQIQRLDSNLEETTNYIRHVLAVYKAKDEMLKEIMAAAQNMN